MSSNAVCRLIVGLSLTLTAAAPAAVVTQSIGFSGEFPNSFFPRFNSGLGTLTGVDLFLIGSASVTLQPSPFNPTGQGPTPYPFTFDVAQHVVLGGLTLSPTDGGSYLIQDSSDGTGAPIVVPLQFTYDIRFDATSDLLGFANVSTSGLTIPPAIANGLVSNYVGPSVGPTFLPFALAMSQDPTLGGTNPVPVTYSSSSEAGSLIVTYTYTPALTPEPAALALVAMIGPMLRRVRRGR